MSARQLRESVDRAIPAVTDGRLPTPGDVTLFNRSAAAAPRPAPQLVITDDRLEAAGTTTLAADPALALALALIVPRPATAAGAPCPAAETAPRSASIRRAHDRGAG